MINILAIGDTANNIVVLQKYLKKSKIHLINFPLKGPGKFTYDNNVEFFDSLKISKQVKKIKQIKDQYDLCLTISWEGARIAYLADLNYIMYFVGDNIHKAPFNKNPHPSYLKNPIHSFNWIERKFLKNIFDNAIECIQYGKEQSKILREYKKDGIRLDRNPVDTEIFNDKVKPIDEDKKKFTFFSPQRQGLEKGIDVIWKSLPLCKSEFNVLQVDWFDKRTPEEEGISRKFFENLPSQVKLIPLIKREEMSKYYAFCDGVIGQMRAGMCGGIEREAAFCKKPVVNYADPKVTYLIDGMEMESGFEPNSQDPKIVAKFIDNIVESKDFRNKLVQKQYNFVNNLSDPKKCAEEWEKIFQNLVSKHKSINRNSSKIKSKIYNLSANLAEKMVYSKKWKVRHIKNMGEEDYEKLSK
jgi:glycosyltransferase involved in cell wall biosynthesis